MVGSLLIVALYLWTGRLEHHEKSALLRLSVEDGHGMLYENIPAWKSDVFEFLDQHVKN